MYTVDITSATPRLSLHEHKDIGTSDFTFSKENYTFFFSNICLDWTGKNTGV